MVCSIINSSSTLSNGIPAGVGGATVVVTGGAKQNIIEEPAGVSLGSNLGAVKTPEPVNGKRKAEEADSEDHVEKKVCV
jgi:hypothetical protein